MNDFKKMGQEGFFEKLKTEVRTKPALAAWARAALQTGRSVRAMSKPFTSANKFEHHQFGSAYVSICHFEWQGVRSATEGQGGDLLYLPEMSSASVRKAADLILGNGYECVVFNGFWIGYDKLMVRLKQLKPDLPLLFVYHGSFAQVTETFEGARILDKIVAAFQAGIINKLGFVKHGMPEAFQYFGISSELVLNRVSLNLPNQPKHWPANPFAAIPSGKILRKNCHTQIIAALMSDVFEQVIVSDNELDYLRLTPKMREKLITRSAIPRQQNLELLSSAAIAFNVTLSECAPMVVLESIAAGTPCISGNNHALLDGHDTLFSHLMVNREDDVQSIVEAIHNVRENYDRICADIFEFAKEYDMRAENNFRAFLSN